MRKEELFDKLVLEQNGFIKTSDYRKLGISKQYFYKLLSDKEFERTEHGIYLHKDFWIDDLYIISLRSKYCIFSHETALFLNGLCDRDTFKYSITLISGYNSKSFNKDNLNVYYIDKKLHNLGKVDKITQKNNKISIYNSERTICDLIRCRSKVDKDVLINALKRYMIKKDRDILLLLSYAKIFHIDKILTNYLEVLM